MLKKVVAYLSGYGNYTYINYHDGSRILSTLTLSRVLEQHTHFIRIHKHAAVNPDCVKHWRMMKKKHSTVIVHFGDSTHELDIARRRVDTVKAQLDAEVVE
ncbi:LytTR family DNA-binding domain-containing protein [Spirosoma agri]|uniref:LytTR family transcriptional regulator n=1 Tax=Spirosoma agri TaxID=1987381 RepID=A0A6M0ING4_9BACT|nr:LytTR family DNA-binding domain-containing protein [Spirosoma agri]NEU68463.1 LytTR family transcriptional regulator [Spirosoma agri]